jgi:uncharacterized membrane protein YhaH (DUF805 family)
MTQYPVAPPGAPPLDWPQYGIGFGGAVKRAFRKYGTFSGRASRSEYWWFALFTFLAFLALAIPAGALGNATSTDGGRTPGPAGVPFLVLLTIFYFGILVPTLAVTVRRLHDAGYSGWLVLLNLVPVGGLVVLIFTLLPTSPGAAKYGPPYASAGYPPGPGYGQNPYPPYSAG